MNEQAPRSFPDIKGKIPLRTRLRFWLAFRLIGSHGFAANLTIALPPGASIEKNTLGPSYMRDCQLSPAAWHQAIPGTQIITVDARGGWTLHQ